MLVAAIAYRELKSADPSALDKVLAILQHHPEFQWRWSQWVETPGLSADERGVRLLMLAARWPDDIRDDPNQHRDKWHYVGMPYKPGQVEEPQIPPPSTRSVLRALRTNLSILRSDADADYKAEALCWILHLVGDIHQPLHTIKLVTNQFPEGDFGGNVFYVKDPITLETTSLHHLWDELVFRKDRFSEVHGEAARLVENADLQRPTFPEVSQQSFDAWARESYLVAVEKAYLRGDLQGSSDEDNPRDLPADYRNRAQAVARRRAVLAGYRLADLLKGSF
jgi:hypothetical protein